MEIFFSHQFSPCGRAGGNHLLRYSGLAIADYGCALKCLAYGSLQLVQDSGSNFKGAAAAAIDLRKRKSDALYNAETRRILAD